MDRNPEIYELLYVDQQQVTGLVDEVLRLSPYRPKRVWETFAGTGRHGLDMAFREVGPVSVHLRHPTTREWVHDAWLEQGFLEDLKLELLEDGQAPGMPVDLAFCANLELLRFSLPRQDDLRKHLAAVLGRLQPGGAYILHYGELTTVYHRPALLKTYRWAKKNQNVKATIKFSDLRMDWVNNTVHGFMAITATHARIGNEVMKPIATDVAFSLFTPGDLCRLGIMAGFASADVFLWGASEPSKELIQANASPFIRLVKG